MDHKRRIMLILGLAQVAVLAASARVVAVEGNSLFLRGYEDQEKEKAKGQLKLDGDDKVGKEVVVETMPVVHTRSAPVLQASWITVEEPSPKDFRVHDLVTIVVNEVSGHSTSAQTQTERDYAIKAALKDWFELTDGSIRASAKAHGEPKLDLSLSTEFDGSGDIKRKDTVTARIQAEVVDVMPNSNIVLLAEHSVTTDDETTKIMLTGVCRSRDVGIDNTILSSQLARLELTKMHTGLARNSSRPGFLARLFEWLSPF